MSAPEHASPTAETDESPAERSASRKVAMRILPLALLAFLVTYIDRANIGITATPMQKDLGLTPASFGLAAGLFYVGYLVMEIPSNLLLERFGARRWIARILVTFGIISGLTAFAWDDFSLVTVRILLGLAEAGMYPGLLLYLGYWFTPRRRAGNWLLFQISLPLGLAVGSIVSSSLLGLDGALGLAGWRWVFVVEGLITLVVGVLIYFGLPDKPKDAKWLDVLEANAVTASTDIGAVKEIHGLRAIRQVLASPVAWYLTAMYFCTLTGFLTVNYWAPTIINERFHLDPAGAGFLSTIPWVVCTLALIAASLLVRRVGHPAIIIVVSMVICAIGMAIASQAHNPVVAFVGLCLATFQQAAVPMVFVFVRAHFPIAVSAVAFAFVNAVSNLAGLVGPTILGRFIEVTGSTQTGLLALSGFFWAAAVLAAFAPAFIRWRERRRPDYFGADAPLAGATRAVADHA